MIHCLSFATYLFDHYVIWASAQYYKKFKVHLNIWVGSDCHWLNKRSIFGNRYKTAEVPELIDCLCSPVLNWAHLLQRRRARQGWPFLLQENYSYHRPFLKNFLKNTILFFSSLSWELLFGTFTHSKPFLQQASNFYQPMFKNTTIMSPPASPAIVRDVNTVNSQLVPLSDLSIVWKHRTGHDYYYFPSFHWKGNMFSIHVMVK